MSAPAYALAVVLMAAGAGVVVTVALAVAGLVVTAVYRKALKGRNRWR